MADPAPDSLAVTLPSSTTQKGPSSPLTQLSLLLASLYTLLSHPPILSIVPPSCLHASPEQLVPTPLLLFPCPILVLFV